MVVYYILTHTDLKQIKYYLSNLSLPTLILCCILSLGTQIISALRSKYYFAHANFHFSSRFAIGLYLTGCLYNSFLPGGISGDGYKIYFLGTLGKLKRLTIFHILVSERANGFLFLLLFAYLFLYLAGAYTIIPYGALLLIAAVPITIFGYIYSTRLLLKENFKTSLGAMPYSICIQGCIILIAAIILYSIHLEHPNPKTIYALLALFLVSNVLATLPISPGGSGIREFTFLWGAPLLGLKAEAGIALALTYFAISSLMALNGLFFWHRLNSLYQKEIVYGA